MYVSYMMYEEQWSNSTILFLQWLDLSVQKDVPISLLIMSRTFFLHDEMVTGEPSATQEDGVTTGLADAMSGIDKEVLNEIVLEMASTEEKSKNADVMKIQLEVLEHQNELIKEEQEERDAAAKEKEGRDKVEEDEPSVESDIISGVEEKVETETLHPIKSTDLEVSTDESKQDEEEQAELSTAEIDAISQLTSPDPVHREREELKRIKDKMQGDSADIDRQSAEEELTDVPSQATGTTSLEFQSAISPCEPIYTDEAEEDVVATFKELEEVVEKEAKELATGSIPSENKTAPIDEGYEDESDDDELVGDKKLQKAINRLKSRVETMVGKIETQLSDVEVKIGDKFHLLDKDGDGQLTMEEMAQVLQTVLKRELTAEEARAIAMDMDQNRDGVFSIAELAQWAESNTIVKLAEDGREKDLDDMITERVAFLRKRGKE